MRFGPYRAAPDWGQIGFSTAIIGWIVWYYFDALRASPNVQNMLLIRPATVAALILYVVIVYAALNLQRAEAPQDEPAAKTPFDMRGPAIASLLCLYVASLFVLGFDVATFGFVALCMWAAGERRVWFLIGFSALFAAVLALGFRFALSVPVPTLLF